MNNEQLNYVRRMQQQNTYVIPTISMREEIDNSIIAELSTIYNPDIEGVETKYKDSLNDISMPNDFLSNTKMISVILTHGTAALMVYMYFHTVMCKEGYKMVWDATQQEVTRRMLSTMYTVDVGVIDNIISAFLKEKLLYIISDEKGQYLTSLYQIFIFERVSAKRLRDRIYKKNSKIKSNQGKYKIITTLPTFGECDKGKSQEKIADGVENEMEAALEQMIEDSCSKFEDDELPFD